jgi:protoporphyrinogen/coproporphyrinogen III oxidase
VQAVGYTEKVVVVGAGISGLACAYRLRQLGIACLVLEAQERAGGLITTIRRNGFLFDAGPQGPRFPPLLWQLVRELNLESEFVAGDAKAKRYIVRDGQLHPAPFSLTALIGTGLVGLKSKLRILTEVFGSSQPPRHEETLADFVGRKFGHEVLNYLVDPFISTIFLGDAHKMGMESAFPALVQWERNHGSLVWGAILARKAKRRAPAENDPPPQGCPGTKRNSLHVTDALPSLGSFRSGMGTLPERLAEELHEKIRYRTAIRCIAPIQTASGTSQAGWQMHLPSGEEIAAEHLILAVPAYVAAQLLTNVVPQLAFHLQAIEYAPVCAVISGYHGSQVANALDGFGFMVPRPEGLQTICTFWNSSLFPQRAPEGKVLITSFAGRGTSGDAGALREEECAQTVEAENAKILGITGGPVDRVIWKNPRALPQYNVGHARRITEIHAILRTIPSLSIAGNFLRGRSISDCIEIAFGVAEKAHRHVRGNDI